MCSSDLRTIEPKFGSSQSTPLFLHSTQRVGPNVLRPIPGVDAFELVGLGAEFSAELLERLVGDVAQAQQLANVVNTVNVVQNGPNNNVAPPDVAAGAAAAATVIQNSLNNQTLQAITTINAAVNSLPQFRQLSLNGALQNALANVVTGLH